MKREFSILGLLATGVLVAAGTLFAFQRGGQDFEVFFQAWNLVIQGHGADVYRVSPDRFLYAPGFAWLFSPIALLPRSLALALWCLAKAAVIGLVLRNFTGRLIKDPVLATGLGGWAALLLARPLLIDFQYGQVNTFLLAACVWALLRHFRNESSAAGPANPAKEEWLDRLSWFVLAIAAVAKLFALPLLAVPFLARAHQPSSRLKNEIAGLMAGLLLAALIPVAGLGWSGLVEIYSGWYQALLMKGFPLESHNQSFAAFLHHYLSGEPTAVLAEGNALLPLGFSLLPPGAIRLLALAWSGFTALGILFWIALGSRKVAPITWIAVVIGLLILPSHLVWKPYFVMGLPLAILASYRWLAAGNWRGMLSYAVLFAIINLTSFDFLGHLWGARFEAAAVLLWTHLLLIFLAIRSSIRAR